MGDMVFQRIMILLRVYAKAPLPEQRTAALDELMYIEKEILPSGSGIDSGTKIDLMNYDLNGHSYFRLRVSFHHMNDVGMYTRWTNHVIIVIIS